MTTTGRTKSLAQRALEVKITDITARIGRGNPALAELVDAPWPPLPGSPQ